MQRIDSLYYDEPVTTIVIKAILDATPAGCLTIVKQG